MAKRSDEIRQFLVRAISDGSYSAVAIAAKKFAVSRAAVYKHLRNLIDTGQVGAAGAGKQRTYALIPAYSQSVELTISPSLDESRVWREHFSQMDGKATENVLDICCIGFTEILNNAKDHSEGKAVKVSVELNSAWIEIIVTDDGVGIFKKIKESLRLIDEHLAPLELSKGKLTTAPSYHTGQGIFFTCRMFDEFSILSGRLFFRHDEKDNDWVLDTKEKDYVGTGVRMRISPLSTRTAKEVYDRYAPEAEPNTFDKTHVGVRLVGVGAEKLVSRSQAKMMLARLDKFREVILDFHGVESIGQAFADEVFRVYPLLHPEVKMVSIRPNADVEAMIRRVTAGNQPPTILQGQI